jgi:hypothetical protein
MTAPANDLIPVRCCLCGAMFAVEIPSEDAPYHGEMERMARSGKVRCNTCAEAVAGKIKAAQIMASENARLTSWQTLCPPEYQKDIEWGRKWSKSENLAKLINWKYGERGLLVSGDNGHCKTRFMWKLLQREWNLGRTMNALTHVDFRATVTALAASEQRQMLEYVSALGKVQILFLDDLGKGRSTPASEEAFFELLNVRLVKCLPTLFTTDLAVERIEAGFSDEYSRGILRRILERVDLIEF